MNDSDSKTRFIEHASEFDEWQESALDPWKSLKYNLPYLEWMECLPSIINAWEMFKIKMRSTTIKPFHLYRLKIIYEVAQISLRISRQDIDIPFFSRMCSVEFVLYYLSSPAFITSTSGYRINNPASWQRYILWTTPDANMTSGDVKCWMVLEELSLRLTQVGSCIHVLWGSNSVKCASVSHSDSNIAPEKYFQDHKINNIAHWSYLIDSYDHFWWWYCHVTVAARQESILRRFTDKKAALFQKVIRQAYLRLYSSVLRSGVFDLFT